MHIALIVHKFPPASLGGVESYTHTLAQSLTASGHAVSVFYRDDGDGAAFREGWQADQPFCVWRVGRRFAASTANPAHLFFDTFLNRDIEASFGRFLADAQPDLVHFQHLMSLSVRLPALVQRAGIPMLLTLHDYWFDCANSQLLWPDGRLCRGKLGGLNCVRCATVRPEWWVLRAMSPLLAGLFQWRDFLTRRAALRIGYFISPSHFLRDQYLTVGFPERPFFVLENGLDVAQIRSFERKAAQDGALRVTFLGTLARHKGVHILVEAMRGLPSERIRLRVVGNPARFPNYAARLSAIADPANTIFQPPVPNALVGQVLAETDLLAIPSLWYENSPVVIQEAYAAGVPVLASKLGALVEKVRDGVDGMLIPPGDVQAWRDALEQLLEMPDLPAKWRKNLPAPLQHEEHVARLLRHYQQVCGAQFTV
ncbi:MAG: glycosyltransferase family 4 protein [Anaerolineae bacterium]|nr:glycosyltransferase family 4 protein [Anaerolineae bacterium]